VPDTGDLSHACLAPCPRTPGRTATGAVSRLENGWASGPWGFDSLSFRSRRHGRARQGSALLPRRRPHGRSQVRILLPPFRSGVVELERRAVVTRESAGSSPAAGASRHRPAPPPARRSRAPAPPRAAERTGLSGSVLSHYPLRPGTLSATPETRGTSCPRGRSGDDAGPSTRKLRVRVPPGVLADRLLAVGEQATPPVSGTGDRRFDSCQPDLFRNDAR
jgi:hypothetical protein